MIPSVSVLDNLVFLNESRLREAEGTLSSRMSSLQAMTTRMAVLTDVNEFFQKYIQFRTETTRKFIENIVNRGLSFIFQDNVRVEIVPEVKANKTYYDVVVIDDRKGVEGGWDSHGGGIMVVVSFIFRFVSRYLEKKYPIMVEDESMADVSYHYQERLSQFISQLCKELQCDLLLVSHQELLNTKADIIYDLTHDGVETKIVSVSHQREDDI